jgi:hypothetical protein
MLFLLTLRKIAASSAYRRESPEQERRTPEKYVLNVIGERTVP